MVNHMPTIGEILRSLRLEKNLKQSDLVTDGITAATISQYEANRRTPSFQQLEALAKKLNVSVSVFFPDNHKTTYQQILTTLLLQAEKAQNHHYWDEALENWDAALIFCRSHHFLSHVFHILHQKGKVLAELNQPQLVIDTLLPLLVHSEFSCNYEISYDILWLLAKCSRELGQWEQSNTFIKMASELLSPSDERWVRMQINLGTGYYNLGDWANALHCFHQAILHAEEYGMGICEAWAHIGISTTYLGQGKIEAVSQHLSRAKYLADLLENPQLYKILVLNEITYHRLSQHWSIAQSLIKEFRHLRDSSESEQAECLHEQILLAAALKDRPLGEESIHEFEKTRVSGPLRGLLWLATAEFYSAVDDMDQAVHALRHAMNLLSLTHYRDTQNLQRITKILEERMGLGCVK